MPSSDIIERFLQSEELPVAVDQIESELAKLWRAVPTDRNLTRVCESNLLVQISSPALIDYVAAAVRALGRQHPCRALVLVMNPHAEEEELSASITALLDAKEAGQRVRGCEQILLLASGQRVQQVSELAFPLVLADLPLRYWFAQGIPEETPLLERLLANEAHVIIDSLTVEDLGITLARANALFDKAKHLGDLNWQRLAPWRIQLEEILAKPEAANLAEDAARLSFVLGNEVLDENQIGQPLLLMSWLAQRFGWELVETLDYVKGSFRCVWEKEGREIVVEIKNTEAAAQELVAFELAGSPEQQIALLMTRVTSGASFSLQTVLARNGENVLQQQTPAQPAPAFAELLLHEFERATVDQSYKETLALATKLI
ncbi:glucose-6-phosphate dehydrogenase assembly protein OpcA [candidate division KSB1 bacterium]|nr:glucose-6-phosphate dehydrogenase assembly protein OpcA [candidate division KSB1 bacterium]